MEKHLASDSPESYADNVRRGCLIIQPMDRGVLNLANALDKMLLKPAHLSHLHVQILVDGSGCQGKPCNPRNVLRS